MTGGRNHARAISRTIFWVAADATRPFKRQLAAALGLDLLGIAAGAVAVGGVLAVVRTLDSGDALRVGDFRIPATASGLLSLTALLTAFALVSAACVYSGAWRIARIAIAYEKRIRERLVTIATDPRTRGWQALVKDRPSAALSALSSRGARVCSVVLRRTLGQILPLSMLAVGSVALVVVDPLLTLLLAPLAVPYLALLIRVALDATRHQREYTETSRIAKRRLDRVIDSIVTESASADWKQRIGIAVLDEPQQGEAATLFYQRRLAPTRMQLFNSGLLAICLAGVLSFFALSGTGAGLPWFTVLFYLVVLRFTIGALRQVTAAIAVLSRHYPEASRMAEFVEGARLLRARRESTAICDTALPGSIDFVASEPPRWGGSPTVSVPRGAPLFVIATPRPTHGDLERVAAQLSAASAPSLDLLRNAAVLAKPLASALPGDDADPDGEGLLRDLGVAAEIERVAKRRREGHSDDAESMLGPEAAYALGASPLCLPHDVTIMGVQPLLGLEPEFVARLLARESDRFVLLVDDRPETCSRSAFKMTRDGFAGAVVLVGARVVACGDVDWLRDRSADITDAFAPVEPTGRSGPGAEIDVDDEEPL